MKLVMRSPSADPADPRFAGIVRVVQTRRRPIFFVAGALLMVISVVLPSGVAFTVAFVSGLLVLGLSAPSPVPWTPTSAMVGAWEWLHKDQADHR
jgi:hypothetical protein